MLFSDIRYTCMALLVYTNTLNADLALGEVENKMLSATAIGNGLILDSVTVSLMGMTCCSDP